MFNQTKISLLCALVTTITACSAVDPGTAPAQRAEDEGERATPNVERPSAAAPPTNEAAPTPTPMRAQRYVPRTFPTPRKGTRVVVSSEDLECQVRVPFREYDFPEGAEDPSVSATGKTMCYMADGDVLCHVSGTDTGLCYDSLDNVANAVLQPATRDGDFLAAYLAAHRDRLHTTISGHSQGAYDAARIADHLGPGDQLFLLQPASAALAPNGALLGAARRGALVFVGWSTNDDASLGIRAVAGEVPLTAFPLQQGIRVHNAPNARDLLLQHFGVSAGRTPNPALDASILSNPGSPQGRWRFPAWREP